MDKEIYPKDTIGKAVNFNYVSIKVQLDTSKTDDAYVKSWYENANYMRQQYRVTSYPTFLFLNAEGELLHKESGTLGVQSAIRN